jgi:hypothetical protein
LPINITCDKGEGMMLLFFLGNKRADKMLAEKLYGCSVI